MFPVNGQSSNNISRVRGTGNYVYPFDLPLSLIATKSPNPQVETRKQNPMHLSPCLDLIEFICGGQLEGGIQENPEKAAVTFVSTVKFATIFTRLSGVP